MIGKCTQVRSLKQRRGDGLASNSHPHDDLGQQLPPNEAEREDRLQKNISPNEIANAGDYVHASWQRVVPLSKPNTIAVVPYWAAHNRNAIAAHVLRITDLTDARAAIWHWRCAVQSQDNFFQCSFPISWAIRRAI